MKPVIKGFYLQIQIKSCVTLFKSNEFFTEWFHMQKEFITLSDEMSLQELNKCL